MSTRYKLILSNKSLYKEIDIPSDRTSLRIGTSSEADVRLRKDLFFSPVDIFLSRDEFGWSIYCSDNLYLTVGDVRKFVTWRLSHGDELRARYQESNIDVFSLSFVIDFDSQRKSYDLEIDISTRRTLTIGGGSGCDIFYRDSFLGNDSFTVENRGNSILLVDGGTRYGVFVNGVRINGSQEVRDYEFFSIAGLSFFYKQGRLFTSSDPNLKVSGLACRHTQEHTTVFEYPKFNRNTRIRYTAPEEELEIQSPPPRPNKPKKNLLMSLIPSVVMLAMTIVLRGVVGGGGTFVIYSAVSMGMGIAMSIAAYVSEKKEFAKTTQERIESYNRYIADKTAAIEEVRRNELRIRDLTYPSVNEGVTEAFAFGKRLFERTSEDPDYLHVYLGKGSVESANPVKFTKQEFVDAEDPLAPVPEQISQRYRRIENAPIISDFRDSCCVGVVGGMGDLQQMLKNISLDIAIRHFYSEVKLVYVMGDSHAGPISWARWLRNVENDRLDIRSIACDEESRNLILEDLYVILSDREHLVRTAQEAKFDTRYVVLVTDASEIKCHPVSKFLPNSAAYGFTFVFFEEHEENLPLGCTEIIRLDSGASGALLKSGNGDEMSRFTFAPVADAIAEQVALKLGAIQVDEVSLEGELTKNITMFEMLGILAVDDLDLTARWENAQVYRSLAAPLGVKNKGQTVYLDIGDKSGAHGPHGLVAGTTGSGKSEILQTYILAMATLYHPYEVGFVIIDFKGGGMANQFKNLPHLIGTITNIDGREINRSLLSIKAELVKRQELFSQSGVNHINDYIRLYKAGKVTQPMPHLIMIVDEFAELKAEHPDFMKELISAARIGRTLGVHLILATQKPAGVVDAQIWSNSKFKLCLKVQTKEDSNEVIKTPLAAEIVEPGRAYFQVGNNEIFDLFQSAYSGAPVPEGNDAKDRVFSIYERNIWGRKELKYTNRKAKKKGDTVSQLQAIVDYVSDHCAASGIARLPGICLPSLPERISTDTLDYTAASSLEIAVPIGMYDDPEQQRQDVVTLELSRDNVYIVGSAQSGKTVMLQTICYGLIRKYTPEQVNLYLVDCGSMVLKLFEQSRHVGGVVLSNEDEKCRNLFKLLNTIIVQRKGILSGKGVGNFAAYLEAGYTDMPMVVVAIDNMAAFKEYFPDQAEELNRLTREAQGVGISFVITAATSNALNYRTQANFGKKLVLNCNDTGEYSNVLGHCKQTPKENPGRGLLMQDKRILEYQTALFGKAAREADRSRALMDYIDQRNGQCPGRAARIPMVPEKLLLTETMLDEPKLFRQSGILPIGMDFTSVSMCSLDVQAGGLLALMGDGDCRDRFLLNLLKMISQTSVFHGIEATVVDERAKKLQNAAAYGYVDEYTADAGQGLTTVLDFCDEVLHRADLDEEHETVKLLVLNSADVVKRINMDKKAGKLICDAIKNAEAAKAFLIIQVENQAAGFSAPDLIKQVKETRQGILFASLAESKLFDVTGRVKADTAYDPSTGYWFSGTQFRKIKMFE